MPRRAKGPRLHLRRRPGKTPTWYILDTLNGRHEESTGCAEHDVGLAEKALAEYLARKHVTTASVDTRDPSQVPVADVLSLYLRNVALPDPARGIAGVARPGEAKTRIREIAKFFGADTLGGINGERCREYTQRRSSPAMARRELEDLRSAINHHYDEGLCSQRVSVVMPPANPGRERWLTRGEVAQLLLGAWRYREVQKGVPTERTSRRHVAKFTLVALYTGTRAGRVCAAAFEKVPGRGYVDVDAGLFYRRPAGERETNKRAPPVPLPAGLLSHLRRWRDAGQRYVVEWNRLPVKSVRKAFANTCTDAGLEDVTPHVLRHTAATWMMQARTDPFEAAGYLGMSTETLLRRYGHHHPDYQSNAKNAFQRMRRG